MGKGSSDQVLELYSTLLLEIWEVVSALIGETILTLLFHLAIKKIEGKYPFLTSIHVSEEGVSLEGVKERGRSLPPVEIHRGFQGFITHLFDLFTTLSEGVINRELFPKVIPKVKEAERMISNK
jgi:hypothetical protein